MPFTLDPEVGAALQAAMGNGPPPTPAPKEDYLSRRIMVDAIFGNIFPPVPDQVSMTDYHVAAEDGHKILLRWFKKNDTPTNSSAVVYYHGGGLIAGDLTMYNGCIARYVNETGVPFLGVDFRPAPEAAYPMNVKDGYAGLKWLFENVEKLGVDPARVAIMGDSGGGAMAACITHWNLDQADKLPIAKQILVYPMLDDRNTNADAQIGPVATWTELDNYAGWSSHLGDLFQAEGIPPSAAPARMTKADGLPPGYIEVGELDIFRDEDIAYAAMFGKAGISMELHIHPAVMHGYDLFAPGSRVAQRAFADRNRVLLSL